MVSIRGTLTRHQTSDIGISFVEWFLANLINIQNYYYIEEGIL